MNFVSISSFKSSYRYTVENVEAKEKFKDGRNRAGRSLRAYDACHTSVRTRVQILRTHIKSPPVILVLGGGQREGISSG